MTQSRLQKTATRQLFEGAFAKGYGPGFQRGVSGGSGAGLGAMLDWFFKQKRKGKKKKKSQAYLVPRVMSVLDLLRLLRSLE